jgi:hypothetical protein
MDNRLNEHAYVHGGLSGFDAAALTSLRYQVGRMEDSFTGETTYVAYRDGRASVIVSRVRGWEAGTSKDGKHDLGEEWPPHLAIRVLDWAPQARGALLTGITTVVLDVDRVGPGHSLTLYRFEAKS